MCKHIVRELLSKFGIQLSLSILAHVTFTVSKINITFNQQCNQSQCSKLGYAKPNINLKMAEIQVKFETKDEVPQNSMLINY